MMSSSSMSNDEALFRAEQGGRVVGSGRPRGDRVRHRLHGLHRGPQVPGREDDPPGFHLALVGAAGNEATRVAEFLWLERSDVRVRRWDPATEAFHPGSGMDEDAEERYRLGVRNHDFDATMGPYPAQSHAQWLRLTSHVTRATTARCGAGAGERLAPGDPDAARDADGRPLVGSGTGTGPGPGTSPNPTPTPTPNPTPTRGVFDVVPYFPGLARQPTFRDVASRAPRALRRPRCRCWGRPRPGDYDARSRCAAGTGASSWANRRWRSCCFSCWVRCRRSNTGRL